MMQALTEPPPPKPARKRKLGPANLGGASVEERQAKARVSMPRRYCLACTHLQMHRCCLYLRLCDCITFILLR